MNGKSFIYFMTHKVGLHVWIGQYKRSSYVLPKSLRSAFTSAARENSASTECLDENDLFICPLKMSRLLNLYITTFSQSTPSAGAGKRSLPTLISHNSSRHYFSSSLSLQPRMHNCILEVPTARICISSNHCWICAYGMSCWLSSAVSL